MARFDGSLARQFDFGATTTTSGASTGQLGRIGLRLALPSGVLRGPDKYQLLEHRRRQAQIKARRLLHLMESA